LVKSFKLVPRFGDEGPRPKKWQIEVKPTWHMFWRENNWFTLKTSAKRKAFDLEKQELS
jgi:hypothetical protein